MLNLNRLGYRSFEKDADRLDTEIFSGAIPPGPIGTAAWNHIHLIPPNGADVTSYPVTVAGLLAALTAATVAGSMIWVPPGSFNTAITIPANIALVALGEKVSINGQWTLNSGVVVANIVQTQSGSSAGALSGVVGPSSGIAYMKNCSINVENSGVGDAYAVNQSGAGELWLWGCATYGNASGGGEGYGARQSAGTLYVTDDGRHRGSTGPFSGTVELFDPDDVIHLRTSTFTKLFNATDAGVSAALTAAASGNVLEFPRNKTISLTSGITLTASVIYKHMNLSFSGFSGTAVTLANDIHIYHSRIIYDGSGQASATAIGGSGFTTSPRLYEVYALAHDATTNYGLDISAANSGGTIVLNDVRGRATGGTTATGIRQGNYVISIGSSGDSQLASSKNSGLLFAGTSSDPFAMPVAVAGWNVATDYGIEVEANDYGAIHGTFCHGDTNDILINSGATLTSRGSYYDSLLNNGTHLNDLLIVNVRDYGATGDGVTDDTTAISNAISSMPSAGGMLYFPAGIYLTSGGFTLSKNVTVFGAGSNQTKVYCNSATAVLFNVTANVALFENIRFDNTAVSTPSAGAGIRTSGAVLNQIVSYSNVLIKDFYINWDIQVGTSWTMKDCQGFSPILYDVKIQNTVNADAGDWTIDGCTFSDSANDADAAIRIESSGGGKISNTKINGSVSGRFNHGIDMSIAAGVATSILLLSNVSIENIRGDAVHIVTTGGGIWPYMLFSNLQVGMYSNTTGYAIYMNAATLGDLTGVNITNCHFHADASNTNPAINLTNVDDGNISGCTYSGFDSLISRTTCTDIYVFAPGTDAIEIAEISAPGTPPSGDGYIYEKTDGLLYFKNDAGTEYDLTGGGGGHTIQDEGTPLTQRSNLNFTGPGVSVTDDAGNDASVVEILGGGGSKTLQTHTILHSETLASPGRFDVSSISQDYDHLIVRVFVRSSVVSVADGVYLLFNNDSTVTNYHRQNNGAVGGAANVGAGDDPQIAVCPAASSTADDFLIGEILLMNYAGSKRKQALSNSSHRRDASNSFPLQVAMNWESTAAINRITLQPDGYATDNFVADSYIEIVGVREEAVGGATYSAADVSSPPTDAELDSAFGTPATVGAGFTAIVDDAGTGTTAWMVVSDGTNWWYEELTKAT